MYWPGQLKAAGIVIKIGCS